MSDINNHIDVNYITIPNSGDLVYSTFLPANSEIEFIQYGTTPITMIPTFYGIGYENGVYQRIGYNSYGVSNTTDTALYSNHNYFSLNSPGSVGKLKKIGLDTWFFSGDFAETIYPVTKNEILAISSPNSQLTSFPFFVRYVDQSLGLINRDNNVQDGINTGKVFYDTGTDIVFSNDIAVKQLLNWETGMYDITGKTYTAWVNIPTLPKYSGSTSENFYISYGDANNITYSGGTSDLIWVDNYSAVYHLNSIFTNLNIKQLNLTESCRTGNITPITSSGNVELYDGFINGAAKFDGSSYLSATYSNGALPNSGNSFSMSVWFQITGTTQGMMFLGGYGDTGGSGNSGNSYAYLYYTYSRGLRPGLQPVTEEIGLNLFGDTISTPFNNDGLWHFFAVTYDANQGLYYFYLDGIEISTVGSVNTGIPSTGSIFIGCDINGNYYFEGLLYDFRIASSTLSADWISYQYLNESSIYNNSTIPQQQEEQQVNVSGQNLVPAGLQGTFDLELFLNWVRNGGTIPLALSSFNINGCYAIIPILNEIMSFANNSKGVIAGTSVNNVWSAGQSGNFYSLIDAPVVVIDFAKANNFNFILDGEITSNNGGRTLGIPLNIKPGQSGVINVWQPDFSKYGLSTMSYAWCWEFKNGIAPILTKGSFSCDQLIYSVNYHIQSDADAVVFTHSDIVCLSHGLVSGMQVQFYNISGSTNVSENTTYFVYVIDENTFNIYSTMQDLKNGSNVIDIALSGDPTCHCTMAAISISITTNLNITSNSNYDQSIINY